MQGGLYLAVGAGRMKVMVRVCNSLLDEELDSEDYTLIADESSVSDSDSDSSELTGRTVSRSGRPHDFELARMYSKGRRWIKPIGLTSGQNMQSWILTFQGT